MELIPITDNLFYVWYGRDPGHANMDMRLGGGAYVVRSGPEALVFDVLAEPDQGLWLRDRLDSMGVERITVAYSHWHLDHIAGAWAFRDCPILARRACLELLEHNRAGIESGELWRDEGFGPMEVVLPTRTFEDRMELRVGEVDVSLQAVATHSPDTAVAWLPREKALLAGDALEDPLPVVSPRVMDVQAQLDGLGTLLAMPAQHIFPSHGHLDAIRTGGHTKGLVLGNMAYLSRLLARRHEPGFPEAEPESFIADELARGDLHWWEPYRQVHRANARRLADAS